MTKQAWNILVVLLAILAASCTSSSPPVHYYSLEPALISPQPDLAGATIVGLGPLRIPDYLKRSQMVTRISVAEVKLDDFARWAEPLDQAIHSVVASNIDKRLADVIVLAYPYIAGLEIDYFVVGRIDRFDLDETGTVVLEIQWGLIDDERNMLVEPRRTRYQVTVGKSGDRDAAVKAMNEALEQLSNDISGKLLAKLQ
ncbi:membrane integrity-associated transporter subunit PqiC [Pseudomonadota bacterium]